MMNYFKHGFAEWGYAMGVGFEGSNFIDVLEKLAVNSLFAPTQVWLAPDMYDSNLTHPFIEEKVNELKASGSGRTVVLEGDTSIIEFGSTGTHYGLMYVQCNFVLKELRIGTDTDVWMPIPLPVDDPPNDFDPSKEANYSKLKAALLEIESFDLLQRFYPEPGKLSHFDMSYQVDLDMYYSNTIDDFSEYSSEQQEVIKKYLLPDKYRSFEYD